MLQIGNLYVYCRLLDLLIKKDLFNESQISCFESQISWQDNSAQYLYLGVYGSYYKISGVPFSTVMVIFLLISVCFPFLLFQRLQSRLKEKGPNKENDKDVS